jgi:hypothetical protein
MDPRMQMNYIVFNIDVVFLCDSVAYKIAYTLLASIHLRSSLF